MIANTWDRGVSIGAEYGSDALDISKSVYTVARQDGAPVYTLLEGPLPPGQLAIVFLAFDKAIGEYECPPSVTPALSFDPITHHTARTKAFRIKTDAPVSAYSIAPYGGARSYEPAATLLLPVSSWAKNYVAVSPGFGTSQWSTDPRLRTLQIIASEDDTEVSIRPNVDLRTVGEITGGSAGAPVSFKLDRGQVLQIAQEELTGSPIEASRPVGLFGGAECSFLPADVAACDMLQQQIPPLSHWGTEYAVVPYPPRIDSLSPNIREMVPYSIVGAVDGTVLTYEPSRPRNAPETIGAGQSLSFITDEVFVVRSQDSKHPFYVGTYMTGAEWNLRGENGQEGTITLGDPEFVNVQAADQYLDRYIFMTDFTFPDTALTVIRRRSADGFMPVELECGGEITGFRPLGSSGKYEYAWVRLTTGFTESFAKGGCSSYGRQEVRSKGPFAITVWGLGWYASYGYVGGTGLRPINDAVPPPVK